MKYFLRVPLLFVLATSMVVGALDATVLAWGNQGHEIVAIIAADNLSPAASKHVAKSLGTNTEIPSLESAMAAASLRPDTEFRDEDRSTAAWHFIDICLQDQQSDVPARCADGNCATAKIDEYAKRLKDGNCDKWGADGDLAFLIHLVGDIHQPLHAATDADKGGNCIRVESHPRAQNLHAAWDTAVVDELEGKVDSGKAADTAHKLEQMYAAQKAADTWQSGQTDEIAWESNQVARTQIYGALNIPVEPCEPEVKSCVSAPKGRIDLDSQYMAKASDIAGQQLAKAGFRLASLLNTIWTDESSPSCH
jgi:S1/P1 Nuclease